MRGLGAQERDVARTEHDSKHDAAGLRAAGPVNHRCGTGPVDDRQGTVHGESAVCERGSVQPAAGDHREHGLDTRGHGSARAEGRPQLEKPPESGVRLARFLIAGEW